MIKMTSHLRRSLASLIIFLMGISIARLFVTLRQQDERIQILEEHVAQLMADTTRLRIVQQPYQGHRDDGYWSSQRQSQHRHHTSYHRDAPTSATSHPDASHPTQATQPSTSEASAPAGWDRSRETTSQTASSQKFTTPHVFDLNTIDSLTLIRIPGIAARTAAFILSKRQQLGGFYDACQLRDLLTWDAAQPYMDEWCSQWFTADAARIQPLAINQASVSQLQRHPYISHDQAVEIVRFRTRHKRISSAAELQQLSSFTPEQLQKLLPYLSFE